MFSKNEMSGYLKSIGYPGTIRGQETEVNMNIYTAADALGLSRDSLLKPIGGALQSEVLKKLYNTRISGIIIREGGREIELIRCLDYDLVSGGWSWVTVASIILTRSWSVKKFLIGTGKGSDEVDNLYEYLKEDS